MNNPLRRVIAYMPQYPIHVTKRFKINAIPHPWYRRIKILPYFVGQRVEFRINFEDNNPSGGAYVTYIWEGFGGREPVLVDGPSRPTDKITVGQVISNEGDIVYKLGIFGINEPPDENRAFTIITGKSKNTDDFLPYIIGAFLAIAFQVIAGVILELINVRNDLWDFWIPDPVLEWLRSL